MIGAGGHGRVLLACLRLTGAKVLGFVDADPALHGGDVSGAPVLGDDAKLDGYAAASVLLVNAIGSTRSMQLRKSVFEKMKAAGYEFATIVHPSAIVAAGVTLAEGAQIMAGVLIQPGTSIGANAIINTGSIVDHDCVIGAHVHVAPGCVLSGAVHVGVATHVGTGVTVIHRITIGANCLVAAGAVVVKDVPDGSEMMGVPAMERRT